MKAKPQKAAVVRVENWPGVLAAFIEERRAAGFDWSRNNCAFFACDWIARVTGGVDPAAKFRRRCTSALTAARLLKAGGGLVALARRDFKVRAWPEIAPSVARRGDVATTTTAEGEALGVVLGSVVAHVGPNGLEFVPVAQCLRAWRIA